MSMQREVTWNGGTHVAIDSHTMALNMTYVLEINTICGVAVPPNTEFKFKMALNHYKTGVGLNPSCTQNVEITKENSTDSWRFCNYKKKEVLLPCSDKEEHYYFSYNNGNPTVNGLFIMWAWGKYIFRNLLI